MFVLELTDALTIRLHANELALLARACRLASGSEDDTVNTTYDAMTTAFTAAAAAATVHGHTRGADTADATQAVAAILAAVDK